MTEAFLWVVHGIGCAMIGWGARGIFDMYQRRIERNKQRGMQE